jgi:hypothetical protein
MHAVSVNFTEERMMWDTGSHLGLEVLEELYNREPKLCSCEMREIMWRMKDEDGGLLFCFAK